MEDKITTRFKQAWNIFMNKDPTYGQNERSRYGEVSYSYRPDRPRFSRGNEKSIVTSVYNRIALDVASIDIKHVLLDKSNRYKEDRDTGLNRCFSLEANIDQTGRSFKQDIIMSVLDEGYIAIVPIDTITDETDPDFYDIESMRTAKIIEWRPREIKVRVYNDKTGNTEELILPKNKVGIIENPLYAIINEPNSTMQRLIRKLNILDIIDEQSGSGKLDLIIGLPYVIKSDARRRQAEERLSNIEQQLSNRKYGIAYTDGSEKITQLNRPVENNLMKQIEYLTSMLYSQLGMTQSILDGTADEKTMLNYYNRTTEPFIAAIVDESKRKFLTEKARKSNESILFFRDPFKLVPINDIAEITDKFTRNEVATSNEMRQAIGWKPSTDPKADELRNSNISAPKQEQSNEQKTILDKEEN